MKILAMAKQLTEKNHHVANILIGKENDNYIVWINGTDSQLVLDKTKNIEIAAGTYNLWIKRFLNEDYKVEQYKDEPMVVVGYENTKHPFLTA